jgi:hypothetical protein
MIGVIERWTVVRFILIVLANVVLKAFDPGVFYSAISTTPFLLSIQAVIS